LIQNAAYIHLGIFKVPTNYSLIMFRKSRLPLIVQDQRQGMAGLRQRCCPLELCKVNNGRGKQYKHKTVEARVDAAGKYSIRCLAVSLDPSRTPLSPLRLHNTYNTSHNLTCTPLQLSRTRKALGATSL